MITDSQVSAALDEVAISGALAVFALNGGRAEDWPALKRAVLFYVQNRNPSNKVSTGLRLVKGE